VSGMVLVAPGRRRWWHYLLGHEHGWAESGRVESNDRGPVLHVHESKCRGCGAVYALEIRPATEVCSLPGCPRSFRALASQGGGSLPPSTSSRVRFG
jgi:hypothetical protein